jgi:parvulin-like peptidyl-prolyl isomerase
MAVSSAALVGCGKGGGNIATVNGEPISKEQYYRYLEIKPSVRVVVDLPTFRYQQGQRQVNYVGTVASPLGLQALSDLVNRTLLLQEAKEAGVEPTAAQIDDELKYQQERTKQQKGDLLKMLSTRGYKLDEIRRDIAVQLAQRNIITKGITVSAQEVDDFIKTNGERFTSPEQVLLQMIVVNTEANKQKVTQSLQSGQNFAAVAQQYTVAPNAAASQYHYPMSVMDQFPKPLQDALVGKKEGQQTDWIKDGNNWVKFYVEKRVPAAKVPIDSMIKEEVKRALALDRGNKAIDLNKRLEQRLLNAKIEITDDKMKEQWQTEIDKLRNEIKNREAASGSNVPTTPTPSGVPNPTTGTTGTTAPAATTGGAATAGATAGSTAGGAPK